MTTITECGAEWIVIATICDCEYVALTIASADALDPDASAESEHEHEIVAYGQDWRELARLAAIALHKTTGRPISAMCTAVLTQGSLARGVGSLLTAFETEVSEFVYAELDTRAAR